MDKYHAAIDVFDRCATAFENRFMELDLYDQAIEEFCNLFTIRQPEILEIGCGPGNVTCRVRKHLPSAHILATDASEKMVELTRKNVSGIEYGILHTDSVLTLKKKFDGIIAAFVLPFLDYDSAVSFIKNLGLTIKEGGFLYLSTMEGTMNQCGFEKTSFSGDLNVHFTYYTVEFLLESLKTSGFSIVKQSKQKYPVKGGAPLTDIIIIAKKEHAIVN